MKLIFFIIAFCLLSIRVYFSWSGKDKEKRGVSESNMVIKSDNFYEEIKYSGIFQFSDDETTFKNISPGGYFKFQKNEARVQAESNLQGTIAYRIYDGKNNIGTDERGKKLIAESIHEMIAWGFDAEPRMERAFEKGGSRALLSEVDSMKTDQVKILYLNRLFGMDSISTDDFARLVKKIKSLGSDESKVDLLNKISVKQFNKPLVTRAYFEIVEGLGSDMNKLNALNYLIDQDSISQENANRILDISAGIGSDMDKANLYQKLIEKGLITGPLFDSLLDKVTLMGSDLDKMNLYSRLIAEKSLSEVQWIDLLDKTTRLGSDMDKSNLLVEISEKMPRTEILKSAYRKAAKSIGNDNDYGKALRGIE
jgi:hypothetical protein